MDVPVGRELSATRGALPWTGLRLALASLLAVALLVGPAQQLGHAQRVSSEKVSETVETLGTLYEILSRCRRSLPESTRWEIAEAVERGARQHGYDPLFVQALVEVESTCSPTAKSHKGALGLIQLRPSTARAVAKDAGLPWTGNERLLEPHYNVQLGLRYLSQLEKRFGDPKTAIAAYNMGPTRVARLGKKRVRNSGYVRRVLGRYQALLAEQAALAGRNT